MKRIRELKKYNSLRWRIYFVQGKEIKPTRILTSYFLCVRLLNKKLRIYMIFSF